MDQPAQKNMEKPMSPLSPISPDTELPATPSAATPSLTTSHEDPVHEDPTPHDSTALLDPIPQVEESGAPSSPPSTFTTEKPASYIGPGWPKAPQNVQASGWKRVFDVLVDVLMALGAVPFFGLAAALASVHGHEVSPDGLAWFENCTKVAGTLFPIFFAAIVGRAATKAAAWHLQCGSRLGFLEQLIGSQTMFSTITTQYALRSFNTLGLSLVMLWILSPFGGQSALRLLSIASRLETTPVSVVYFDSGTQSQLALQVVSSPTSQISVSQWFLQMNALYIASLLAPPDVKNGSMDLWSNVKIPFMSSYTTESSNQWVETPKTGSPLEYSSLVGISIAPKLHQNTTLLMESTYIELNCSDIGIGPIQPLNTTAFLGQSILSYAASDGDVAAYNALKNGTFQGYNAIDPNASDTSDYVQASWSIALDVFVNHMYNSSVAPYFDAPYAYPGFFANDTNIEAHRGTLLFQNNVVDDNWHYDPTNSTHASCIVSQVYVESNVSCMASDISSANCSVVAQRPSTKPHAPSAITALSFPDVFSWMSYQLPRIFGNTGQAGTSDVSAYYINNTATSFITNQDSSAVLDNVTPHDFSVRLGQLLNTYLMLTQAGFHVTGDGVVANSLTASAAHASSVQQVYRISWSWFAVFVLATTAMFAAGVFSMYHSRRLLTPDVLGFVSSGIRDSRYLDLPAGGGTLSGMEMSRQLMNLRLRFGNVGVDEDGRAYLGIASEREVTEVSKTGKYL